MRTPEAQVGAQFKERLRLRQPVVGTFIKTPHPAVVEILGLSGLGCICIDAEHAPFGRAELNVAILAAHAAGLPAIVRVPSAAPHVILNALDLGATGILAPHICSAAEAAAVVAACRFGPGGRGYSGSTRAAAYGTRSVAQNLALGNCDVSVLVQIEDAVALPQAAQIAATDGVDCLFVGPMDLTVSLGANTPQDPIVDDAIQAVVDICQARGKACGIFTSNRRDVQRWLQRGVNLILAASDQQWMLEGATELARELQNIMSSAGPG